jgi:hypothetical protein
MERKKHTPKAGEIVVVRDIPDCNFCEDGTPGPYDFATRMGPWASGCAQHYALYQAAPGLGVGKAQLWITEDQVAPPVGQAPPSERIVVTDDVREILG